MYKLITTCYCDDTVYGDDINVTHRHCKNTYPKYLLGMDYTMQEIRDEMIRASTNHELIPCTLEGEDDVVTCLKVAMVA